MRQHPVGLATAIGLIFALLLAASGCGNPSPIAMDSKNACPNEDRIVTLTWGSYPQAALAKTYVAWDVNPDGSFTQAGKGGNGNLGHSAQVGASCCRPAADPVITARIPDHHRAHTLHVYALGADGYFLAQNPVAEIKIAAENCR